MEDIIFSAKQVQGKKALFGKGRFALQNVDFELPSGYIMGIIGETVPERRHSSAILWRKRSIIAAAFIWTEPISRKIMRGR